MTPDQFLQHTKQMEKELKILKSKSVFVGLPKEKVGGKIYGDGQTIFSIGVSHEYGVPQIGLPQRSFLRGVFAGSKEFFNSIAKQFKAVTDGRRGADQALGIVGVIAVNRIKGAFTSAGYGKWKPIKPETKRRKGSSQILIDTGILRSSVDWVLRNER